MYVCLVPLLLTQANLEDGCVKVKMTFVVKVHPAKKGSDNFPQFLHKLTASSYSHSPICDIHEVACATHKVACMEVSILERLLDFWERAGSAAAAAGEACRVHLLTAACSYSH